MLEAQFEYSEANQAVVLTPFNLTLMLAIIRSKSATSLTVKSSLSEKARERRYIIITISRRRLRQNQSHYSSFPFRITPISLVAIQT